MAAYASLVSLLHILDQIENHPRLSTSLDKKQIESLRGNVSFLEEFMEANSHGGSRQEAEVLESQIASAAYEAEDLIESHVVDQIQAGPVSLLDLTTVIQDMDSVKEKVVKFKEEIGFKPKYSMSTSTTTASSELVMSTGKSAMVGFNDELIQLMDVLTGQRSALQIIPIVGMGGIGKTTLARNVYESSLISHHFDIRAWATISQDYSLGEIFSQLLSCQSENEQQLGEKMHKSLYSRRYLIILDDMWRIEAWDQIKFFFPDNNNGSRIIVTTRLSNLAIQFSSSCLAMKFLDEDKSWKLFREKAFGGEEEGCPPELEEIGKKIVEKCRGLPLSIVVIAGVLGKFDYRTREYWESVSNDMNSVLTCQDDEHCMKILSLSYAHLSSHLKPCFLYMGIFPEDHQIRVSRLVKLWVAEGFMKPSKTKRLEEVAEGFLKDLVDRNLVLVRRRGQSGKIKTCNVHDLLRDLCLQIANKEKFLCVVPQAMEMERRIVFHDRISSDRRPQIFRDLRLATHARSLICKGENPSFRLRLLRVVSVVMGGRGSLKAVFQQVNLRYVYYMPVVFEPFRLHSSVSLLWNMQTLIVRFPSCGLVVAPPEIWEMPTLRHLEFDQIYIPDPPSTNGFVLRNLQTLLKVVSLRMSREVCKRIPNVKKLHLIYNDFSKRSEASSYYGLDNLHCLLELESLNSLFRKPPNRGDLLQSLTFPSSLKKLSLTNCGLYWEDLTMIGSLPSLEVLKLESDSVRGSEWNPVEDEFVCLKSLKISICSDLIYWNADDSHFPVLERLFVEGLSELDEIPPGIGDIPTLRAISLCSCSESAAVSALNILEEQESLENEGLRVRIEFVTKEELERFRENVELESFTSNNFQLMSTL